MRKFFTALLLFVSFHFNTVAQQITIAGKNGERQLEWKDFNGSPDESVQYKALTFWSLNYGFSGVEFDADKAIFKGLQVSLNFENDKSWVKENMQTSSLLKHEQGHFDIGKLCQLEILVNIKATQFEKSNFKSQFKELFKNAMLKYKELGIKYDEETNHSINEEKQEKWNNFLLNEHERLLKLNNK